MIRAVCRVPPLSERNFNISAMLLNSAFILALARRAWALALPFLRISAVPCQSRLCFGGVCCIKVLRAHPAELAAVAGREDPHGWKRRPSWPGAFPAGRGLLPSQPQRSGVLPALPQTPTHAGCLLGEAGLAGCFTGATHRLQGPTSPWLQAAPSPPFPGFLALLVLSQFGAVAGFSQQGDLGSLQKAGGTLAALSRASCRALVFSAWFNLLLVPLL